MDIDLTPWRGRRVCIALSGGGDSVALFDWCVRHAAANSITLSAVHVEHGIRGSASQQDAAFINTLCARACVPLFCFVEDVPALAAAWGMGLEEAGRRVRYARFCKLLAEDKADVVFTAHHAGDNAESVLLNLFRGASLAGAGGICYPEAGIRAASMTLRAGPPSILFDSEDGEAALRFSPDGYILSRTPDGIYAFRGGWRGGRADAVFTGRIQNLESPCGSVWTLARSGSGWTLNACPEDGSGPYTVRFVAHPFF